MTRRAIFACTVDGVDVADRLRPRLSSLTLTEKRAGEADELTLVLSDHDGRLAIPPKGARIRLSLGWRDLAAGAERLVDKGAFVVDERGHGGAPDVLTLKARSADFRSEMKTARSRSWTDASLGSVLDELARANGLSARIAPELASRTVSSLQQSRESDLAFLARLGRRYDAVATVKNAALVFAPIGAGRTSSGDALPAFEIARSDGDGHAWSDNDRNAGAGAVALWWDADAAAAREVRVGEAKGAKRLKKTYPTKEAATEAAEAHAARASRSGSEFSLALALARFELAPEQRLKVSGFKPPIDATPWLIAEITHTLDAAGGATTRLKAEPVGSRPRAGS